MELNAFFLCTRVAIILRDKWSFLFMVLYCLFFKQMTATHQLKNAVASVAYAGRPLLLTSFSGGIQSDDSYSTDAYLDLIFTSLSNALLGMDANDPPKTVATMQLIGSIFSNVSTSHNSSIRITGPGTQELVKNYLSLHLTYKKLQVTI
jgi:hypothetical protein